LGFPTANIDATGLQLPPDGVYAVRAHIGEKDFQGIANLGIRPTVSQDSKRVLEVHLFEFDGDLYGMDVEVEFLRFVRGERKFASLADLRAQIDKDIAEVRT
jgi:riboflavin kinase/FMN adenylyltransferase